MIRIGHGYDVHRFTPGRPLMLGGVRVPYEYGLDGHSDADVLLHAICDALLGSLALGDIGKHFPDSDPAYHNIESIKLLAACAALVKERGYSVVNVDATVIAQKPKLAPFIDDMRQTIAAALGTDASFVSVKATTEEGLGFTGALEGVAAHAVALVQNNE
ncbi:MAG: 2-C-methyl-D-erythritol 2,4-cyclodiphosphate synthase [Clostridia bacterium]|nr:2-C-methyl-D-erythritol 2,4-cyclodiphosphate synthase [Clostridia bacterium]